MSKPRPSDAELRKTLFEGHFRPSQDLAPSDPLVTTQMVVDIEQIVPYEHNPRHAANPIFLEIKESIRTVGLKQILIISRRPGDKTYTLKNGGNTRLKALQELYAETRDDQFHRITCMFEPWESESTALAAHLIENDTRSELIFIDRARAIRAFRDLIEQEQGTPPSQRELVRALEAQGYRIARPRLTYLDYALDVLAEALPLALDSGAGRPIVIALRRFENVLTQYLAQHHLTWPARELFLSVLARCDAEALNLDTVRRTLEEDLADRTGVRLSQVRLEFDVLLAESAHARLDEPQAALDFASAPITETAESFTDDFSRQANQVEAPTPQTSIEDRFAPRTRPRAAPSPAPLAVKPSTSDTAAPVAMTPRAETDDAHALSALDMKDLRARMVTRAMLLAQANGFTQCVVRARLRAGFLLDTPAAIADMTPKQSFIWWLLANLSGQFLLQRWVPADKIEPLFDGMRVQTAIGAYVRGEPEQARPYLPHAPSLEEWGEIAFFELSEREQALIGTIFTIRRAIHLRAIADRHAREHEDAAQT